MTITVKKTPVFSDQVIDTGSQGRDFRMLIVRNSPKSLRWGQKGAQYIVSPPDVRNEKMDTRGSECATPKYALCHRIILS